MASACLQRNCNRKRQRREESDYTVPKGFLNVVLPADRYLLVTLSVWGSWQTNGKVRNGNAVLMRQFKVHTEIAETCPKQFQDLSEVLPKMANLVSLNEELTLDFSNHLWHLGIETNLESMHNNYDVTGRNSGGNVELVYKWYLKGSSAK